MELNKYPNLIKITLLLLLLRILIAIYHVIAGYLWLGQGEMSISHLPIINEYYILLGIFGFNSFLFLPIIELIILVFCSILILKNKSSGLIVSGFFSGILLFVSINQLLFFLSGGYSIMFSINKIVLDISIIYIINYILLLSLSIISLYGYFLTKKK